MIKVAILGGGIGAQHLAAYQTLPEFDVILAVDRDRHKQDEFQKAGVRVSTNIKDAMNSDANVIDICLPPSMHVKTTLEALEAGKHVICEKPIAASLAEVDQLEAASCQSGCHVFPVFQYRFGPAFAQLSSLRENQLLGDPKTAALETHWNRDSTYYDVPWRGTWDYERGGAIISHAIHAHER